MRKVDCAIPIRSLVLPTQHELPNHHILTSAELVQNLSATEIVRWLNTVLKLEQLRTSDKQVPRA